MHKMLRVLSCLYRQPKFMAPKVDMTGKTIVITGPTIGGIGYTTAETLASFGAHIILAARNLNSAEQAAEQIREQTQSKHIYIAKCDLAQLDSVSQFVEQLQTIAPNGVDVLICNAGAQFNTLTKTEQGVEMTFAVCALAHHKLIHLIQPSRVVWVTGDIYALSKGNPNPFAEYAGHDAYMDASLARLRLAREWKRRTAETGSPMQVVCVHPGVINTEFVKAGAIVKKLTGMIFISPELGAQASILAASADVQDICQDHILPYYHNKNGWMLLPNDDMAMNEEAARKLFDQCDEICGINR